MDSLHSLRMSRLHHDADRRAALIGRAISIGLKRTSLYAGLRPQMNRLNRGPARRVSSFASPSARQCVVAANGPQCELAASSRSTSSNVCSETGGIFLLPGRVGASAPILRRNGVVRWELTLFDIALPDWYTPPLWPENGPTFATLSVPDPWPPQRQCGKQTI